jgi:hypothetical protein
MIHSDDRASAEKRSHEFTDNRLIYFWDGDRFTGKLWQRVLKIGVSAWDVYLLYDAGARWEREPAAPSFWMHQLRGAVSAQTAPFLQEPELERKVRELLGKAGISRAGGSAGWRPGKTVPARAAMD